MRPLVYLNTAKLDIGNTLFGSCRLKIRQTVFAYLINLAFFIWFSFILHIHDV
jgi:hypothetical protein